MKTQHRLVALFEATMIRFDPMISLVIAPMFHPLGECFGNGPRIRVVTIGGHLLRAPLRDGLSATEKALRDGPVALRAQHRIHQIAISVDGAIQVTPLATRL